MSERKKGGGVLAFLLLVLMALGVVFGDIGTSPLYTEGELFFPNEGVAVPLTPENIIGANSAMLWFMYLIVGGCYCVFALSADHHGEGGVLALFAKMKDYPGRTAAFMGLLLILGTGLLMGDGAITPPISIIGGLEGLAVATKAFDPWIVPLTVAILSALFAFQRKGTAKIGLAFGPIMLVWFTSIAAIGVALIREQPEIMQALLPHHGILFLLQGGNLPMKVHFMGGAMLALTGGEALYADLGHFSKNSIRVAFGLVVCCTTLNYLGQGAYLYGGGEVHEGNVFYSSIKHILGDSGLYAMIGVGTSAAIIASQALITGMFSLVALGIALKLLPKVETLWTSEQHKGQIYQPTVNFLLYCACLFITVYFRSTKNLAAAYGLAVAALMLFTCSSLTKVAQEEWKWSKLRTWMIFTSFLLIELGFVVANAAKFTHGGWFPCAIGVFAFTIMTTWRWGVMRVADALNNYSDRRVEWLVAVKDRLNDLRGALQQRLFHAADLVEGDKTPTELDRSIVFLTSRPITEISDRLPASVMAFIRRYGALPRTFLFFHVFINPDRARLNGDERIRLIPLGAGIHSVVVTHGYMEVRDINVRRVLQTLHTQGLLQTPGGEWEIEIGEEEIIAGDDLRWYQRLRLRLYRILRKLASPAHHFLGLEGDPGISKTLINVEFTYHGAVAFRRGTEPFAHDETSLSSSRNHVTSNGFVPAERVTGIQS